jgi:hypothetical protein
MQFHSTYVQRRRRDLTYREFQRLWRSHGDFAATVPAFWCNVDRYIHNDPVESGEGLPYIAQGYDGVGELYYTSYDAWVGMRDVMWKEVAPDEKRVFAGAPVSVRGTCTVHQQPTGLYKLFTLGKLSAPSAVGANASSEYMDYIDATLSSQEFGGALRGFTITEAHRSTDQSRMDSVPQTASSHDILLIHHFESEHAARTALQSRDYLELQMRESRLFDWPSRLTLLCRAWVLKG